MGFPRNDFITTARAQGHSEGFIRDALQYADNLERRGLPVIFDAKHLAFILNMSPRYFYVFTDEASEFYKYFAIKKRSRGLRRIMAPYENLKEIQLWIKTNILDKIDQPRCVMAFAQGRGILMNAKEHEGRKFVLKMDISDFFESIDARMVYKAFRRMGYEGNVAICLTKLCTAKITKYRYESLEEQPEVQQLFDNLRNKAVPFLIQGAPTSPSLANIICEKMDKRMKGLADKLGCTYTRYADDMTFSADDRHCLPKVGMIKKIVASEGFRINDKKTELLHEGNKQMVTGLLVDGHVRVPGHYKRDIMRHIRFCQKYGGRSHFNHIAPNKAFGREWLLGRINFVKSVEPNVATRMMEEFKKIDWM